ncbi:MAG: tetratricopeptide repeat protein, partial [Pseudomonadota bacterium]
MTDAQVSPLTVLREAMKAVPAVKYALGVAGIAAAVAIVAGFQIDYRVAVFGTIIMVGLMFVLVVLSKLTGQATAAFHMAGLVATLAFILLTIATASLLLTSYFFTWPRSLESFVKNDVQEKTASMLANFSQGFYDPARRIADEILAIEPANYRALHMKGSVAFYDQDYKNAVSYFEQARKLKPDNVIIASNLAAAYVETNAIQQAIKLYDSIRDSSPRLMYSTGRAYLYADDFVRARELLEPVPTDYGKGGARVLEAAALSGLAKQEKDSKSRATLISSAKKHLQLGIAQDPAYWKGILNG